MKVPDTFLDQVDIFVLLTAFGGKGDIILPSLPFVHSLSQSATGSNRH